jgi:hypothetical protein
MSVQNVVSGMSPVYAWKYYVLPYAGACATLRVAQPPKAVYRSPRLAWYPMTPATSKQSPMDDPLVPDDWPPLSIGDARP